MEGKKYCYKDLIVWQKALDLVLEIYRVTETFPKEEKFGLVSQMRRCAVSIHANIAEGRRRINRKDFRRFLIIAFGSGGELETEIEIAKRLNYNKVDFEKIDQLLEEVMRMLNKFIVNIGNEKMY